MVGTPCHNFSLDHPRSFELEETAKPTDRMARNPDWWWVLSAALLHVVRGSNSTGTQVCIKARGTGLCMADTDPKSAYGADFIELANCGPDDRQLWYFDAGSFAIKSAVNPNKCIDAGILNYGQTLEGYPCNGQDSQVFGYDSSEGTIYLAKSKAEASLCLDVTSAASNGSVPETWWCNGYPYRDEPHSNPSLTDGHGGVCTSCWPLGAC